MWKGIRPQDRRAGAERPFARFGRTFEFKLALKIHGCQSKYKLLMFYYIDEFPVVALILKRLQIAGLQLF